MRAGGIIACDNQSMLQVLIGNRRVKVVQESVASSLAMQSGELVPNMSHALRVCESAHYSSWTCSIIAEV
jgi:hypothetical protein